MAPLPCQRSRQLGCRCASTLRLGGGGLAQASRGPPPSGSLAALTCRCTGQLQPALHRFPRLWSLRTPPVCSWGGHCPLGYSSPDVAEAPFDSPQHAGQAAALRRRGAMDVNRNRGTSTTNEKGPHLAQCFSAGENP